MNNFKQAYNVIQTYLVLAAGIAALVIKVVFTLLPFAEYMILVLGSACVVIAVIPMAIAHIQQNWPKK